MRMAQFDDVCLHYRVDGPAEGPALVFANSLGTDMRLWDALLPLLPPGLRIVRFDKRGHGLSSLPPGPYTMGALIRDTERLLDLLAVRQCCFVGLSIGGMIAQGLAVKRPDLIAALVLSNTGTRIGTQALWADRIAEVEEGGIAALSEAVMARWFSPAFRQTPELALWHNMLLRQPAAGYTGCSAAISGTDFYASTAMLRLPALGIAGDHDGSTPPDLVRETISLIPDSRFALIRGAGHLPCVEQPAVYADHLNRFLAEIGFPAAADQARPFPAPPRDGPR